MYDPDTRRTEREFVTTNRPAGSNFGGAMVAVALLVIVILGAVWLSNDGAATDPGTTSPTETTAPVETTIPDTTLPTDDTTSP